MTSQLHLGSAGRGQIRHWPVQGSNSRHWPARKAVNYTVGQRRGSAGLAPFSSPSQASAGRVACATAPPGESLRGGSAWRAHWPRATRARGPCGHMVACEMRRQHRPSWCARRARRSSHHVGAATGNAAPVTPCGAALAAPGATAILRARSDVPMCLVDTSLLNTSAVFAVEQASTQVDAVVDRFDAVVGRFGSELDVVLKAVLAQQTKLGAQAGAVACLTGCIATGSCTCGEGAPERDVRARRDRRADPPAPPTACPGPTLHTVPARYRPPTPTLSAYDATHGSTPMWRTPPTSSAWL